MTRPPLSLSLLHTLVASEIGSMEFLPARGTLTPTSALGVLLCTAPSVVTSVVFLTPLTTVAQVSVAALPPSRARCRAPCD